MRLAASGKPQRIALCISVIASVCALFLMMLGANMGKELSHDEHMYVASGYLLGRDALLPYRDYPYLQMPYLTFVYALLFLLTDRILLVARLFSTVCSSLLVVVLFWAAHGMGWRGYRLLTVGLGGAVLLIANPVFIYTSGLAWNHDFPVLLSALALIVYCRALQREDRGKWVAVAGALLGIAVGARLIFALLLIPFLLVALFYPGLGAWKTRLHSVTSFLTGIIIALLPALLMFALSGERFVWGNLGYHQLNELYRRQTGHTQMMALESKLAYLRDVLTEPGTLILLLLAAILLPANLRRMRIEPSRYAGFALAISLVPFAVVGALIPTPTWYQYYYAPVPLLVLGAIYGLVPHSAPKKPDWRLGLFLVAVIASGVGGLSGYLRVGLLSTENWVPIKTHRTGEEIKGRVPGGKVLTLAPIFPLEGGVGIYEELAAGPFTWRSATLLPAGEREQLGIVSERELGDLLASDPPAGILVGYEADLEGPLVRYAQDHGFVPLDLVEGKMLWVARR